MWLLGIPMISISDSGGFPRTQFLIAPPSRDHLLLLQELQQLFLKAAICVSDTQSAKQPRQSTWIPALICMVSASRVALSSSRYGLSSC
jgi:hypothetical protein